MGTIDMITTGRPDLTRYARKNGILTGARLDHVPEYEKSGDEISFIDMHWNNPDFGKLLKKAKRHNPKYVIAGDYSRDNDNIQKVNAQARVLNRYCEYVIVVPKIGSHLEHIPDYSLVGYSTPSEYEGTEIPLRRYKQLDNEIHILGGTPHKQHELIGNLWVNNVQSADSNSIHKAATIGAKAWYPRCPMWRKIDGDNAVERAYRMSVDNVVAANEQRGLI